MDLQDLPRHQVDRAPAGHPSSMTVLALVSPAAGSILFVPVAFCRFITTALDMPIFALISILARSSRLKLMAHSFQTLSFSILEISSLLGSRVSGVCVRGQSDPLLQFPFAQNLHWRILVLGFVGTLWRRVVSVVNILR